MKSIFILILAFVAINAAEARIFKHRVRAGVADPRSDLEASVKDLLTAPALPAATLKAKLFNAEIISTAALQGRPARRTIGKWKSTGVVRSCNNGVCGNYGPDVTYLDGGSGNIDVVFNAATSSKPESIDFEFRYYWSSCTTQTMCMRHLLCSGAGQSDSTKCDFTSYFNTPVRPGENLYNSAPRISQSDAAKYVKQNDLRVSTKGVVVVREYYEPQGGNTLSHTVRIIRGDFAPDAFVTATTGSDDGYLKTVNPELSTLFSTISKAPILSVAQVVTKFFDKDNLDIASMQSTPVVRKTIAAYSTHYLSKTCDGGVCSPWKETNLVSPSTFGGEGSITLECTVPDMKDLSKSSCKLTFTMKGPYGWEYQTWTICDKVGGAVTKCEGVSAPSYFASRVDDSTGKSFWDRQQFVHTTKTNDQLFFTNDLIVSNFKWNGKPSDSNKLVYTDLYTISSPLSDYTNSFKSNCLSKATSDDILKTAQEKKGLKNKIVLQKGPLDALIKAAPYKSVEEAVVKISGIGPVNVVYVSFWYNFFC